MFRRILAPLDGSENAERVLPWLKRYAGPDKAEVTLLRAVSMSGGNGTRSEFLEARDYLQSIERELNYAGVPARIAIRPGPAAAAIVRSAALRRSELIVIATRGGSPVARWLIGGTTEQVMRASTVPVLIVRSQTPLPKQGRVRRIIVPLDGSALAESILPWIERLARFHRARPIFLHVRPRRRAVLRDRHAESYAALKKRIFALCHDLRRRGLKTEFRVEWGDAASKILATCAPGDLIAMTTHGFGGFKRWILGSVAEKVIHEATVPVLIYRRAAAAAPKRVREAAATAVAD